MCESSSLMPPSPSPPRPPGQQQTPEYKHFCRVCNKGFTCGSALGGHMRAHGASDVIDGFAGADDDDGSPGGADEGSARWRGGGDDRWDAVGTTSAAATHAYALRANPNRLIRSCQVCKNCGKEFTSWELFLRHGKCSSEDDEGEDEVAYGLLGSLRSPSSPPSDADGEEDPAVAAGWSKGKRSRRVKLMVGGEDHSPVVASRRDTSGEEEDLANCLVMLSSSSNIKQQPTVVENDQKEQSATAGRESDRGPPLQLQPISFFVPASEPVMALPSAVAVTPQYITPTSRNVFECKACKKVFTSHQALGGHRASHKKVKGCFAARFESNASEPTRHATTAGDPSNISGRGATLLDAEPNNAGVSTDAKASVYPATTNADANAGKGEAVASSLSMALAPTGHNPPPVTTLTAAPCKTKNTKMHECSVCHRLFTSGQALGGHKRCHWLTSSTAEYPGNPVVANMIPPLTEDLVGVVRHQLALRAPMADAAEPVLDLTMAANPSALAAAATRPEAAAGSSFRLDALAPVVHLQPMAVAVPASTASHRKKAAAATSSHHGIDTVAEAVEDEADSTTAKRAKLSDLKDVVSMDGDGELTGPWLQVGIGSSSAGGDDKTRESAIN